MGVYFADTGITLNFAGFILEQGRLIGSRGGIMSRPGGYCSGVVTLCYAIVIPSRKSVFRAGLWPDCYRESIEIGPPTGLRPAGGPISVFSS